MKVLIQNMSDDVFLKFEHIRKQFGPVKALDDINFEIRKGEVHCLVGENGAGKSTLMKILSGAYDITSGAIYVDGKEAQIHNPAEAAALGITVVYQEMNTVDKISILDNMVLGSERSKFGFNLVKENRGIDVEFDKDMADQKVYKLWQEGKSCGIFQFESQGMTNFMKELKPDCLEDLIAGVSLYRPGPMDQIPRYIKGKLNPGHNEYTHPSLEPILNVTYGCMVYQEQVMEIVRRLAGYSLRKS